MLNRSNFGTLMAKVCPADATHDEATKRLLANIDRVCEPKADKAPANGN